MTRTRSSEPQPGSEWIVGGGEMGRLIRAMDWSPTPLGPIALWPQSLRTTVNLCLASDLPICIIWGPDLVQIYNDGYRVICGEKHPRSMGQNFPECWREAWPVIGAAHDSALAGDTAFLENQHIFLERHGYIEECFFTFSFSPIRDETGRLAGLFHPVIEMTPSVLGERRTRTLRDLASGVSNARSVEEAFTLSTQTLCEYPLDLPFVLIYRLDETEQQARLVAATGLVPGTRGAPASLPLQAPDRAAWPLGEVFRAGETMLLDDVAARFGQFAAGAFPEFISSAVLLPITTPGAARPMAVVVAGVSPRLRPNEMYGVFHDLLSVAITTAVVHAGAHDAERNRAEALAKIDRMKTAFFANVSHEFRTPLTLMLGPLEDALQDARAPLAGVQQERLATAHRNSLRLLKLVNTLLDFSRIEAGRAEANPAPTDLAQFTADLAAGFRSACERAGLRLVVDCPPLPELAVIDRDMWEKIVLNLMSNAFKFTFEGTIAVQLRPTPDGRAAVLEVRDSGVGIPAQEMPRLFERFHRIEGQKSRSFEGSGIGLALVQELVQQHRGTVAAQSVAGEGTSFTVTIPFGAANLAAQPIAAEPSSSALVSRAEAYVEEALRWLSEGAGEAGGTTEDASRPPGPVDGDARAHVLIADDNADMREYLRRLLESRWNVEAVGEGQAALEAIRRRKPDLLLTDVMMPGLDGFEILREIRADPALMDLPVILLSARADEEAQVEGLDAGADDYLTKPFSARELLARVAANIAMARVRRAAVEMVAASEARAGRVLAGMTEGYVLLDREYRVIEINEEGLRLDGRAREAFIGRLHWDIWPGSETGPQGLLYKRVMESAAPGSVESHYEWEDGHSIWFEIDAYPVPDGLALFYRDISARRLADEAQRVSEAELRIAEGRYRAAIDAVDGILWTNNPYGEMQGEQPAWAGLTGQTTDEYQGYGWSNAVHPDDAQPTIDAWNAAVAARRTFVFEHRVRRHDGAWRQFSIRAVPSFDAEGGIVEWVGVHTDITGRHASEVRNAFFLKLTDRLRALSDPRDIVAAAVEQLGRHLGVSRAGYAEVAPEGDPFTFVTDYVDGVAHLVGSFPGVTFGRDNIADLRRGLTTVYPDVTADPRTSDADFAAIETRAGMAAPLIRDGRLSAVLYINHREVREWRPEEVALVQDVAARTWDALQRARAETALRELNATLEQRIKAATEAHAETLARLHEAQKVETLGQLTGGVAHDFNNLLTPIMGGLDILSRKLAHDERAQRIASGAMQSAERAKTLIQRLLSFGRRQTLQSRAIDLATLIEGMRDLIERSIGPLIQITLDVPGDLPAVEADPNQLELAILNLCVNARDAMEGAGRLTIAAARIESKDGSGEPECVALRVSDTGKGMDQATLAKATEPFFTTKGVGQGTGLGLSMVYGLAAQSGGKLTLTSAVGQGTTVELVLPVSAGPAEIMPGMDTPAIEHGTGTILLVDDEELVRMSIADGLRDLGYKVVEAASAAGALERLREGLAPDVLVTDHMMPGMTGATLAREARNTIPSLPVLMITGYANLRPEETRGLDVIAKPFHRADLAARIADLIKASDGKVVRLHP